MARKLRLTAADGHVFDAFGAMPDGTPIGGLVVVQEIFGVTQHIQRVVDQYAAAGFAAVAPAMFDRIEPDLVIDYSDIEAGRAYMRRLEWPAILRDVEAAIDHVAAHGRVGLVGYCWGGAVAHVAAAELNLEAAVAYYGTGTLNHLDKTPRCPVMYHFGADDKSLPPDAVDRIMQAHPDGIFHIYPGADHGFNCDDRPQFDADAARLAYERSLEFLRAQLGSG